MHYTIENANYYSDSRVTASDRWYSSLDENRMVAITDLFDGEEEKIPFIWDVCPTCEGRGKHVNPSIDCNGLTSEDFYEDPDFAESYMRGDYDQPCNGCDGDRVVPVPANKEDVKKLERYYREEAMYRAECLAEIRMGA